jgi:hypothetical protein
MNETLWRHIQKEIPSRSVESFVNPTHMENVNKDTELDRILEKMMKLNSEKKGFTKLPFLENIYDSKPKENFEDGKKSEETEENQKEGFLSKDFADKELEKQLKSVGLLDDRGLKIGSTTSKGDRWCATKGDKSMTNINVTEMVMFYIGMLPRFAFIPFYLGEYVIKKLVIIFTSLFDRDISVKHQKMIINEFYKSINFFIIIAITYNWFFLLFYYEDGYYIDVPSYDTNFLNDISSIVRFIFEYSLLPVTFMHKLFVSRNVGPTFFYSIYNITEKPLYQWWILFFIVYLFLYPIDQGGWFKKYIFSCGEGKEVGDGFTMIMLYISILKPLALVRAFIDLFNVTPPKSEDEEREEEKYKDSYLWHISNFLKWGLRVGITYTLYPFTLFLMFFYFVTHSLFSVKLYEDKNAGFMEIMMNIVASLTPSTQLSPIYKKMNKFMKGEEGEEGEGAEEGIESSDESSCKPDKNKISPFTMQLMNVFLLLVFSRGISENMYNFSTLENRALKGTLISLSGLCFFVFGFTLYNESNKSFDEDYEDFSDPLGTFFDADEEIDAYTEQEFIEKVLASKNNPKPVSDKGPESKE